MDKYAIIVAGGSGTRMGASVPKQFLLLHNKPILWYPLMAFMQAFPNIRMILVLHEQYLEMGKSIIELTPSPGQVSIIAGGSTRFESVRNGLIHVPEDSIVFVHDGVRCLVTAALIQRCYQATLKHGNAIPAVSAVDTIRIETQYGYEMIDRSKVKIIQTPQTFFSTRLKKAYRQQYQEQFTDDASVLEGTGEKINFVEGEITNIKITRQLDLLIADQVLNERRDP
ncbi:MAG: 2-C-methyl-D-erythritol 4-phosphate cytidylyltransferase [Bacteroidota bacterium]